MAAESRLGLNWSEIAAGGFAALAGAAGASLLGLYGTPAGAGVMGVVTTVTATVSHHCLSRLRARFQRLRHGAGTDTRPHQGNAARSRRWKGVLGAATLVAGTAVATVAALQFVALSPIGKGFLGGSGIGETQPRPVIVKKIVKVEGEGPPSTTDGGEGGHRGDGAPESHERQSSPPTARSGDANGHSRSDGTADSERTTKRRERVSESGSGAETSSSSSSPVPSESSAEDTTAPTPDPEESDESSGDNNTDSTGSAGDGSSTAR